MTKEEVAQWAVNNRYPKSENNKISDSEMYHTLIKKIEQAINYTHSCETLPYKALNIDQEEFINNCQDYFGGKPNTNNQR